MFFTDFFAKNLDLRLLNHILDLKLVFRSVRKDAIHCIFERK